MADISVLNSIGATMQDIVDGLAKVNFDRTLTESHKDEICVMCGAESGPHTFDTPGAWEDYTTNGMCQDCQDRVYRDSGD